VYVINVDTLATVAQLTGHEDWVVDVLVIRKGALSRVVAGRLTLLPLV
jgi:hypothetical protein